MSSDCLADSGTIVPGLEAEVFSDGLLVMESDSVSHYLGLHSEVFRLYLGLHSDIRQRIMLSELYEFSANFLDIKRQSYQRHILQEISLATRCCIIQGDRGIGKTTTLVQYLLNQAQTTALTPKFYISPLITS